MEAPAQTQPQTQPQVNSRRGGGNQRRGRRGNPNGRGQPRGGRRGGSSHNAAASSTEQNGNADTASIADSDVSRTTRGRDSRRARGGQPRGSGARGGAVGAARRAFGGRLTQPESSEGEAVDPSLSAEAAEFVPGQPVAPRNRQPQARQPRARRMSVPKSTAADFGTRIHEDMSNHNYECTICTDEVLRTSKIWTCTLCWTTVHQKCVGQWYRNQKTQWNEQQAKNPGGDFKWRCPGCNSNLTGEPAAYHCWCGKELSPSPASKALPPHSCGQTCSKPRATCPHPCFLQCHAGPCPPCDLMGPVQSCFCGKNTSQKLCRETDYENGESCGEICGDLLPCGEHACSRPCHSGVCGDCDMTVEARCFCGNEKKEVICSSREDPETSYNPQEGTFFEGSFYCSKLCERLFDCGVHKCEKTCHAQDEDAAHCPFSPDVITTCPCGKTDLSELLDTPRQSCQDSIPRCNEPCEKLLPCGHTCQAKCHTGDCGSCNLVIDIACRCGRNSTRSLCHQGDLQPPLCTRICQANLNCARHKCGERCCTGEKKAIERQAAKRKQKLAAPDLAVEAEHICIRNCGRPLKCGLHDCQQICHRGPCASCPEAIFDEIACACGMTVLQPPQPCGTQPPACQFPCRRRPECGHPAVDHHCHGDDKDCPKCPFQVKRWCACGKRNMPNQPCHLQEAHCGLVCGKKLKCGLHSCRKLCHKAGECEDEGTQAVKCSQSCGKAKLFCDHKCQQPCHGTAPCNENIPCPAKTTITCPCGIQKQEVRCAASSANPNPERPELKCDDECLRQDRNRRLAAALNIDPTTHTNDHVPYSDTTLALFRESKSWSETQEREFRVFSQSPSEVRLQYKAMPREQRQFLHALADDYGLESRSEDEEPFRYVVVYKGQRYVSAPSKTLGQCIKIRDAQAAEAAASAAASRDPSPPPPVFNDEPFNAFLLLAPRFGLTTEEVTEVLKDDLAKASSSFTFSTYFLPTDEVAIRATAHYSSFLHPSKVEQELAALKPRLAGTLGKTKLAGSVVLCHLDGAEEVTRREIKGQGLHQDGSGWSAVATRGAAARKPVVEEPSAKGTGSGRKLLGLRKKKIGEPAKEKPWAALGSDVEC